MTPDHQITEFSDLRVAEKEIQAIPNLARNYYIHLLPELTYAWWTNKDYKYKSELINPYKYTCTCTEYQQRAAIFPKSRDIRRACKHIYYKFTDTKLKQYLDSLSHLLLKSSAIHNEVLHFKYEYLDKQYYFGFKQNTNWINVYLKEDDEFRKFGFNPVENRWSYKSEPRDSAYAILMMERIAQSQLPFTHNWIINKSIQR